AFVTVLTEPLSAVHARLGEADWARELDEAFTENGAPVFALPASFLARPDAGLFAVVAPLVEYHARRLQAAIAVQCTGTSLGSADHLGALLFANLPAVLLELLTPALLCELHRQRDAGELD